MEAVQHRIGEMTKQADWQTEKHVPVIECAERVKADEWVSVKVTLGKAVAHPNTTEHHIRWIRAFFTPDGDKVIHELGTFDFAAHGESVEGANKGSVYTNHEAAFSFKTSGAGTLHALAYCNIHGLWESEKRVELG
ncbi:MAG: class II SORL domain-containing protein [Planctomycetota bacterium]|jgi:superoxide reductase